MLVLAACAPTGPAGPAQRDDASGGSSVRSVPQRPIVIAFSTEVDVLEPSMNGGTGNRDYDALTNSYLAYLDPQQRPMPFLAEELPSVERGTWKVLPDGRMETTYRLKKHPTWHDGVPITAHDFVFAHRVRLDPTVAMRPIVEARISAATALDDHTLYLEWKEPYIWAGMISPEYFAPLPRHRLEELYTSDKTAFREGPHWRTEWVGSGPYRLESWEQGVEMRLRAHEGFAFGKPPVDQLIFRFITDANTIVANLLAGNVDVAFHSSIGFSQNQALEQAGFAGTTEYWSGNPRYLEFQTRDWGNLQRAVLDPRVRRATLHAVDRQAIVDGLYAGKARAMHVWLHPNDPAFPAVDRAITKYEFDPQRAEALLAEAGWTKGSDGIARNAAGEPLHLHLLNQSGEIDQLEAAVVLNYWKTIGITSEIQVLSRAQQGDGEFRAKFPAVSYNRITIDYEAFPWLRSKIATPENRWVGTNRIGYVNPVVDESWTKALGTISDHEREPLIVEALRAMTADAVVSVTHLQPRPVAYRAGLTGPRETWVGESALIWNSWEWTWTG
jgi:peptide/nickel transport system substrate-binding protein